jgi:hypothetical protein
MGSKFKKYVPPAREGGGEGLLGPGAGRPCPLSGIVAVLRMDMSSPTLMCVPGKITAQKSGEEGYNAGDNCAKRANHRSTHSQAIGPENQVMLIGIGGSLSLSRSLSRSRSRSRSLSRSGVRPLRGGDQSLPPWRRGAEGAGGPRTLAGEEGRIRLTGGSEESRPSPPTGLRLRAGGDPSGVRAIPTVLHIPHATSCPSIQL